MRFRHSYLFPALAAAIMSYLSSRYIFVGSGLSLIPWGILALAWGFIAKDKRDAKVLGAIYGFCQSFIFLWVDKRGNLTLMQFLILFVIISSLSLLAAACAMLASWLSFSLVRRWRRA